MALAEGAFVRTKAAPTLPAPVGNVGFIGWLRTNLFSSPFNSLTTILALLFLAWFLPPIIRWGIIDAAWDGTDRNACLAHPHGACWAFIKAKFGQAIYGRYPIEERWRVDLAGIMLILGLIPMAIPKVPFKRETVIYLLLVVPVAALILLTGGNFSIRSSTVFGWAGVGVAFGVAALAFPAFRILFAMLGGVAFGFAVILAILAVNFGLVPVGTDLWGGLLVTLVVALVGIAASLPIGIALALGRRSRLPIIRFFSIVFIEFWRGVPLITVLFMSSVMLPVFLPPGVNFDKLLRALIGVALFSAAYMAEVVRGGLQAIPRGQFEGSMALGLGYWPTMRLIVLPQALKLVIPGIVNSFISLFKDTSLVLIIGIFDLLGIMQVNFNDANWAAPEVPATGYAFAAFVFWAFCFGMSRYSIYTERRLQTGHRR